MDGPNANGGADDNGEHELDDAAVEQRAASGGHDRGGRPHEGGRSNPNNGTAVDEECGGDDANDGSASANNNNSDVGEANDDEERDSSSSGEDDEIGDEDEDDSSNDDDGGSSSSDVASIEAEDAATAAAPRDAAGNVVQHQAPQRIYMLRTLPQAVSVLEKLRTADGRRGLDDNDDDDDEEEGLNHGLLSLYVQCRYSFIPFFDEEAIAAAIRRRIGEAVPHASEHNEETAPLFRRLVELLSSGDDDNDDNRRPGLCRDIVRFVVVGFPFGEEEYYRAQDVRKLVEETIPSMHRLTKLVFKDCALPALSCLDRLALPPHLLELELTNCVMDGSGIGAIAALVRRPDCRIKVLAVTPSHGGLQPDDCRTLCDSVQDSGLSLRVLRLKVKNVLADTLVGAIGPTSPIRELDVVGPVTKEGGDAVSRRLRTNTRLVKLSITDVGPDGIDPIELQFRVLLFMYNYTLRRVRVLHSDDETITRGVFVDLLRGNRWIRTVIRRVLRPNDYRITPPNRWPLVYGQVSTFPTLLYRLLRKGDVNALCEVLQPKRNDGPAQQPAASRGRKRSAPDDDGRSTVA